MSAKPSSPPDPLPVSPSPPPRRRGAQPGNKNALKHGYYAGRFHRADLKAYRSHRFAGLTEEIALLRLYIRRIVDLGVEDQHFFESINLLRALSLAVTSLDRLVKTQAHLIDGDDDLSVLIREVYEELTVGPPGGPPDPPLLRPREIAPQDATVRQDDTVPTVFTQEIEG